MNLRTLYFSQKRKKKPTQKFHISGQIVMSQNVNYLVTVRDTHARAFCRLGLKCR